MTTPNSGQFALVLDTESSGTDPHTDRLITAYVGLVEMNDAEPWPLMEYEVVALPSPDFEMPEGAAAVNGYTTERLRSEATLSTADVVQSILEIIASAVDDKKFGIPLIGYNVGFDLSLLYAEAWRAGIDPSPLERIKVLDALVLWRRLEPKRSGGRRLIDAVAAYHLHFPGGEYHTARFDAIAAGRIVQKQLEHDLLRGMPLDVLHEAQALWYRDQALDYQAYRRRTDPTFTATKDWPLWKKEAA